MSDPGLGESGARTTHRGVHWYRDKSGNVSFYDQGAARWTRWVPDVDAPPLPPKWQLLGVPTRVDRPGWRSPWRLIPAVLITGAVVVAVLQSVLPSSTNVAKEARSSEALLGRCLARDGSSGGHPKYASTPVSCASSKAAVKVVRVLSSGPDSPLCPPGTTGVELPYAGVAHPHVECLQPLATLASPG
jgi:hypothetical protein